MINKIKEGILLGIGIQIGIVLLQLGIAGGLFLFQFLLTLSRG